MSHFEIVPKGVYDLMNEIINNHFLDLNDANILVLYQDKPRKSKGFYTLGSIQLPGKMVEFISELTDEVVMENLKKPGEKIDYIMILDKTFMDGIATEDEKVRLVRHELRHCHITDRGKYRIKDHDIQDFTEEIKLNGGDFNWAAKAVAKLVDKIEQDKDAQEVRPRQKK